MSIQLVMHPMKQHNACQEQHAGRQKPVSLAASPAVYSFLPLWQSCISRIGDADNNWVSQSYAQRLGKASLPASAEHAALQSDHLVQMRQHRC